MTASINCSNMKCPDKHCFYIVASGVTAQRFVVEDFTLDASSPKRVIRKGTIVENVHVEIDENFAVVRIVSEDEEERNGKSRVWLCRRAELRRVKCRLAGALEAAPPHARLAVVENKFATDQLLKLNIGEMVNYYLQESSGEPELSLLNYKGPVPEIGPGIYFGLELLVKNNAHSTENRIDFKKYNLSPNGCCVFATINQLGLYSRSNVSALVESFNRASRNGVVSQQTTAPMPSNEKVSHQSGDGPDQGNFKTTLVLHLKEKEHMPRHQQKSEALIGGCELPSVNLSCVPRSALFCIDASCKQDLDPFTVTSSASGLSVVNGHSPVHEGDHALWQTDAIIQQDGHTLARKDSVYNRLQEKKHGALIPGPVVVKPDNTAAKQKDAKKKQQLSPKFIENCCNGKSTRHSSKQPGVIQRSESFMYSSGPLVELSGGGSPGAERRSRDNVCKSEYVFSEVEAPGETEPSPSRRCCNGNDAEQGMRSREGKLKTSLSQDSRLDLVGDVWPSIPESGQTWSKCAKPGSSRRQERLGSGSESLEIVGERVMTSQQQPYTEVSERLVCTSPDLGRYHDLHQFFSDSPEPPVSHDLGVGSVVEVTFNKEPRYGVIRWIGTVPDDRKCRKVAGIEMEAEYTGLTDGTFNGRRYFHCNPKRSMFVNLSQCQKDSRFQDVQPATPDCSTKTFGQIDCPPIKGPVRPISRKGNLEAICGKNRGIQGHHNSCYLDATLFSMFTFTSVFDSLLFRPRSRDDSVHYDEVQRVLREEIVNPLRTNLYVRADRVMKLRTLLENLSSVSGLTSEEKDPEEFLNSLVAQILKAEPFLKLSSGQEAYHYQLFVEKDEHLKFPTVQQLLEQSFLVSGIKLKEVPSCLIIQMPRFGKSFKMYQRIFPSQLLDVTDIIEDSPRQCLVCGKLAEYECKECYGQCGVGIESTTFCIKCLETVHSHERRKSHVCCRLKVPTEFRILQDHCPIPRLLMELFAVVCIETSHYVAFVKCGSGSEAPWCFFDSMADRKGEQNGYNIPEMVSCPNLPYWLSEEGMKSLQDMQDDRQLPEYAKRLLCDAYMCMYQSPDVMMYR